MSNGLLSFLAPVVILCLSLAAGILAGAVAWATVTDIVAHAGDDIDLVLAMFDGRSLFAGLFVALITTLITATLLDWVWKTAARKAKPR